MTMSNLIKIVVALLAVAAFVATRFSISTNAYSKSNKIPHRYLKGSRKLQFNLRFSGGRVSGTATGGGSATGSGSAQTSTADMMVGVADGTASGEFTVTSGSSGFVDTVYGSAEGSAAAGGTGSQAGNVGITLGGLGTLTFDGTTSSFGMGSFGAGFSPVPFNTVITEVPGTPIPATSGSKKGGATGGGATPPTFIATVVPVSTGPTGGFGSGSGSLGIASTTTGTLMGDGGTIGSGIGSSGGAATNFGGGSGSATNYFGTAGGIGSGAGTSAGAAAGKTKFDETNGIFTGTGGATSNFNNQGTGFFGTSATLAFP